MRRQQFACAVRYNYNQDQQISSNQSHTCTFRNQFDGERKSSFQGRNSPQAVKINLESSCCMQSLLIRFYKYNSYYSIFFFGIGVLRIRSLFDKYHYYHVYFLFIFINYIKSK